MWILRIQRIQRDDGFDSICQVLLTVVVIDVHIGVHVRCIQGMLCYLIQTCWVKLKVPWEINVAKEWLMTCINSFNARALWGMARQWPTPKSRCQILTTVGDRKRKVYWLICFVISADYNDVIYAAYRTALKLLHIRNKLQRMYSLRNILAVHTKYQLS